MHHASLEYIGDAFHASASYDFFFALGPLIYLPCSIDKTFGIEKKGHVIYLPD